jgi:hypothetical protein
MQGYLLAYSMLRAVPRIGHMRREQRHCMTDAKGKARERLAGYSFQITKHKIRAPMLSP